MNSARHCRRDAGAHCAALQAKQAFGLQATGYELRRQQFYRHQDRRQTGPLCRKRPTSTHRSPVTVTNTKIKTKRQPQKSKLHPVTDESAEQQHARGMRFNLNRDKLGAGRFGTGDSAMWEKKKGGGVQTYCWIDLTGYDCTAHLLTYIQASAMVSRLNGGCCGPIGSPTVATQLLHPTVATPLACCIDCTGHDSTAHLLTYKQASAIVGTLNGGRCGPIGSPTVPAQVSHRTVATPLASCIDCTSYDGTAHLLTYIQASAIVGRLNGGCCGPIGSPIVAAQVSHRTVATPLACCIDVGGHDGTAHLLTYKQASAIVGRLNGGCCGLIGSPTVAASCHIVRMQHHLQIAQTVQAMTAQHICLRIYKHQPSSVD